MVRSFPKWNVQRKHTDKVQNELISSSLGKQKNTKSHGIPENLVLGVEFYG